MKRHYTAPNVGGVGTTKKGRAIQEGGVTRRERANQQKCHSEVELALNRNKKTAEKQRFLPTEDLYPATI